MIKFREIYDVMLPKSYMEAHIAEFDNEGVLKYRILLKVRDCLLPEKTKEVLNQYGEKEVIEILWYPESFAVVLKGF